MFAAPIRHGLELRLLEERHAAPLFRLVEQERVHLSPWLAWVGATHSNEDTLAFIQSALEQFASNEGFAAGIWSHHRLAGTIGTHRINWLNRKVELGYWLAHEFQGQGIMTDSCRAVVNYLFKELDLNRVEIHCSAENVKSAAIPLRLGFQLDGTMRKSHLLHNRYHDLLVFGMLKSDWAL